MSALRAKKTQKTSTVATTTKKHPIHSRRVTLKPRMSEKTYALSEADNTYVFEVPTSASKQLIAQAVAAQYEVSVLNVRISATPGKSLRTYRRGGRVQHRGQRSAMRKAFVSLKEGDKLPIFAAIEDDKDAKPAQEKK